MAKKRLPARRVREPVQVYLDERDRGLLEAVVRRTGLSRAEILRRGLRRLADYELIERAPGWSFDWLIDIADGDPPLPSDLSERHDEYLYGGEVEE